MWVQDNIIQLYSKYLEKLLQDFDFYQWNFQDQSNSEEFDHFTIFYKITNFLILLMQIIQNFEIFISNNGNFGFFRQTISYLMWDLTNSYNLLKKVLA